MERINNLQSKRNYLMDNIKAILIFLVVAGHVYGEYRYSSNKLTVIYFYIFIFHMPVFIFVSGYFSKNVEKCSTSAFKKLFLPYLIFNSIWYMMYNTVYHKQVFYIFKPYGLMWFLLSLFFWRISLKYIIRIKHILFISIILAFAVGLTKAGEYLSLSRTFVFWPFFLAGYFTKKEHIELIRRRVPKYLAVLFIAVVFILISYLIKIQFKLEVVFMSTSYRSLGLNTYIGIMIRGLCFIAGILMSLAIIRLTPEKKMFFSYIGGRTMTIYLGHVFLRLWLTSMIIKWNSSVSIKLIILISPIVITYILSIINIRISFDHGKD